MQLICVECKNTIDLSAYPNLEKDHVIECDICGISLLITDMTSEIVIAEVTDEGK